MSKRIRMIVRCENGNRIGTWSASAHGGAGEALRWVADEIFLDSSYIKIIGCFTKTLALWGSWRGHYAKKLLKDRHQEFVEE